MTDQPRNAPTKVCPSCGTRVNEDASRCLVCGHQFTPVVASTSRRKSSSPLSSGETPELHLSLPLAIGLLLLFIIIGGGVTYFGLAQTDRIAVPTGIPSATPSPSATATPTPVTPVPTSTQQATFTPIAYSVQQNDTCGNIAAIFNVSVQSIVLENSLASDCSLFIGQVLNVPQPTFTSTPQASPTLSEFDATVAACSTELYVVQQGDTLSFIAQSYGIPMEAIQEWNGLTSDTAFLGQQLIIPLCERVIVGGSTVTPTIAPDYPAPELLLPADGASFDLSSDTVTLQWSSVGSLRNNEFYQIMVIDVTGGQNERLIDEVVDTSFIIPTSFRPTDGLPHVFRWTVVPVAQIGVDAEGLSVYVNGGPVSDSRVFTWAGTAGESTPTP